MAPKKPSKQPYPDMPMKPGQPMPKKMPKGMPRKGGK